MQLNGKKILLAVSGSIAAYKAAHLTRLLVKMGAEVQVLMTPAASAFISPLTLATLSRREVYASVATETGWNNHVELGLWADVMLIAPVTANTLGKLANGICDSILTACYLSARCPVLFAPAMDLDMWKHPATQRNVSLLQTYGNVLIPPENGELASGLVGEGRMAEPEHIVQFLVDFLTEKENGMPLLGKKCLITSGPTYEAIDPVRFIGNRSSGKMGTAIADELARNGANVVLVTGPTQQKATHRRVKTISIESAQEMYDSCLSQFETADISIFAAAVADYRPKNVATQKIKKTSESLAIDLETTTDIAKALGQLKQAHQYTIGFALETENEETNAMGKLERKNLDMIVLNSLQDVGAGFGHDTNRIKIFDKKNQMEAFDLLPKSAVAAIIVKKIIGLISSKNV